MKILINQEDRPKYRHVNVTFGMDPEDFLFEFGFGTTFTGSLIPLGNDTYRFNVDQTNRSEKVEVTRSLDQNNLRDKRLLEDALRKDFGVNDFIILH